MQEPTITSVDPITFEYQDYSKSDEQLIPSQSLDTAFSQSIDYVELYVYDNNQELVYPSSTFEFEKYQIREGDVLVNPARDIKEADLPEGEYFSVYNFFRRRLASSVDVKYYIDEISPSRTELRLRTNQRTDSVVFDSFVEFQDYRALQPYFVDFLLNFGNNQQVIGNNLDVVAATADERLSLLVKLYEPLPADFAVKDTLWIVEEISTPQAYSVNFPLEEIQTNDDFERLKGPNFNIDVNNQTGIASNRVNYTQVLNTPTTSSLQQLKSLLQEKSININVDYEDRSEYIKFSSAEERLKNFYYKVSLIESTQNTLSSSIYNLTGATTGSTSYSSSKASLESVIDSTIENFDGYEYFLYFNSGSNYSWPKSTDLPPYTLYSTGSTEVLNWYGSKNDGNLYYGGQILSASEYDQNNNEWLYNTIPEYLLEDPDNQKYELFLDMIAQHFDNVWLYTKDVTNKFNADNRLDYGISKDLVADAIRDFGVKLYSNNYDENDLYQAFLGITAEGSTFPVSGITGSFPVPSGSGLQYVETSISASNDIIPQNDVLKSVYKRIYHNLPFLLKSKGTIQGLKVLLNSFGIADTVLDAVEYGGAIRRTNTYEDQRNLYNYYLDMNGAQSVQTNFELNPLWSASDDRPGTVMFRIQPEIALPGGSSPTNNSQTIFSLDTGPILTLDYTGSYSISGSYSGSIVDPEYQFAQMNFYPEGIGAASASIYLPFFNGDWWNVMLNYVSQSGYILTAKNKNIEGVLDTSPLYTDSDSIQLTGSTTWATAVNADFGSAVGAASAFSGGLQEIRYYTSQIPESVFDDFAVNSQAYQGTGINLAPDQLAFRATLGGELYTGSESVHPKLSGSWQA